VRKLRFSATLLASLFIVSSLHAVTYIVPTDRDLVRRADAIVVATAIDSHAAITADGRVVTIATLGIDEVLKGAFRHRESVDLYEMGGVVGDRVTIIPGSPRYTSGERYLVFLRRTSDGWATYGLGLGRFDFVSDLTGRSLVKRAGEMFGWDEATNAPHIELLRDADGFRRFVETTISNPNLPAREDYFVRQEEVVLQSFPQFGKQPLDVHASFTRPDYLLPNNFRWQNPSATFDYCCNPFTVPGGLDGPSAISSATANWTNAGANIHYSAGSHNASATHGLVSADGINAVLFNDPSNQVPSGAAAIGGISNTSGAYQLADGFNYNNTSEVDVVVGKSFSTNQATFIGLMTHEIGHTLGFRHSNMNASDSAACSAPLPCSTSAIMNTVVGFNLSSLQQWDLDAAQTVYGSGPPPCVQPALGLAASATPSTISAGQSSQLSVGTPSAGTAPFTYVWRTGGQAVGSTQQLNVSPTVTTTYTVTITNSCGNTTSSTTVTVNAVCTSPTISANPQSQSTSTPGTPVTLSVGATGGTPQYSYQWFTGTPGFGTPIAGQTLATLTVSPTVTTTYYATVTSSCGGTPATSAAATITVGSVCTPPQITVQPLSQSISSGSTATLSMGYSGTAGTVTWYQGTPTNRGSAVGSGQIFTTPPLTANTNYWAEIVNTCGNAQTAGVTITVIAGPVCTIPTITLQPASQSISSGGTASLSMGYSGSAGTVTWYQGTPPIKTTPVGSTQNFTTPALTANTSYWAEVVNNCGSAQTIAAVITVTPANTCSNAAIVSHPVSGSIIVGGITTLSVSASGSSPLSYQWYQGAKGDTSKPVGTNSASFTSSPINANTSFWVRVTNTCNGTQTADSNAASITVTVARHRGVRH
jgi:hypothetical protein